MGDLTIVFYTANYTHPDFFNAMLSILKRSIGDLPVVSVSHKPMDFGNNICVGDVGRSHLNIYRQILIGAKAAETEYVALAEDDILYPPSHFELRPSSKEVFCYDINKWSLFTWTRPPIFSFMGNAVVHQLISSKEYLVNDLEERFVRWPDEEKLNLSFWKDPGRRENRLGMEERKIEKVWAPEPTVAFSHEDAFGYLHLGNRKAHGEKKIDHLYPWGTAEQVLKLYKKRDENQS